MTFTTYLTGSFTEAFYSGVASTTPGVPHRWHVALAGRGYMLDLVSDEYKHQTVPMLKQQPSTDQAEPGETTLNPEGAWRRSSSSWHLGASQEHRDLADSVSTRFNTSKGVDVWTRGQLTLLNQPVKQETLANSGPWNVDLAITVSKLYFPDGNAVYQTDMFNAKVLCTGTPVAPAKSLVAVGNRVYVAFDTSGIYKLTADEGTSFGGAAWLAGTYGLLGYAKGRLLAADANTLYDVSTGTATTLLTHNDPNFAWVSITEGTSHVYAAGNSGAHAFIYRIGVKSDGTGLDVPIVAARLPTGEQIGSIYGYAGLLLIGVGSGFRVAAEGSSGDLTTGPLVEPDGGSGVAGFAGFGRYVYFTQTYGDDPVTTGLSRMDLSKFTEDLVPAYARDIYATPDPLGLCAGVAVWARVPVFAVNGDGIYWPIGSKYPEGTLESGRITFGVTEPKTVVGGVLDWTGPGTAALSISTDDGTYTTLEEAGETERGSAFETRITLTRDGTNTYSGPTVRMTTLFAYPAPKRTTFITLPLLLHSQIVDVTGADVALDVDELRAEIESLFRNQQITTLQEGLRIYTVKVEDYAWVPDAPTVNVESWNGTFVVKCKVVN